MLKDPGRTENKKKRREGEIEGSWRGRRRREPWKARRYKGELEGEKEEGTMEGEER